MKSNTVVSEKKWICISTTNDGNTEVVEEEVVDANNFTEKILSQRNHYKNSLLCERKRVLDLENQNCKMTKMMRDRTCRFTNRLNELESQNCQLLERLSVNAELLKEFERQNCELTKTLKKLKKKHVKPRKSGRKIKPRDLTNL